MNELSATIWTVLITATFLSSVLSVSVGAGGPILFASMAAVLPLTVVVPVHACVTFLGNVTQWSLLNTYVDYRTLTVFTAGALFGLGLVWPLIGELSDTVLQLIFATFLLLITWYKALGFVYTMRPPVWLLGVVTSYLSALVGVTRPAVAGCFATHLQDHKVVVATTNACVAFQHGGKIIIFFAAGIGFTQYWRLILSLVLISYLGVLLGKRLLFTIPQRGLDIGLKIMLTAVAAYLLVHAISKLSLEI